MSEGGTNDADSFGSELGALVSDELDAGTNPYLIAAICRSAADHAEVCGTAAIADDVADSSSTETSEFRVTEDLE